MNYFKSMLAWIGFLSLATGCVLPDKAYMFQVNDNTSKCHGSCIETKDYLLGFVEFDDDGYYHNRLQREEVFDWVKDSVDPKVGAIIISFSHGWKNNASNTNGNRREFTRILKSLAEQERGLAAVINVSREAEGKAPVYPRKVIGLYTGWRGKSLDIPILDNFSFWERKKIAHLIGQRDGKDYFSALNAMKESIGDTDTRLVIVGHSFGGVLVHSATTGLLVERFNQSIYNDKDDGLYNGIGDLVVLINPAFEALDIANQLTSTTRVEYSRAQRPYFMILASETDGATNIPFKMGRFFTTLFDNYANDLVIDDGLSLERRKADNTAIGHYSELRTHTLKLATEDQLLTYMTAGSDPDAPNFPYLCELLEKWPGEEAVSSFRYEKKKEGAEPETIHFALTQDTVDYRKPVQKQNPYLVVSVENAILPGHRIEGPGKTTADDLLGFIGQMVVFRTVTSETLAQCKALKFQELKRPSSLIDQNTITEPTLNNTQ